MAKTHAVARKSSHKNKRKASASIFIDLTLMIFSLPPSLHPSGWAKILSVPMVVYEPLIRLFYVNLRSPKDGEIESLVLDLWPPKEPVASNCDVSIEQAKREIILDPSLPIPSHLGPKDLPFETRVIAHIIATTLLPRVLNTDADDLDDAPVKSKPSSSTSVSTTKPNVALDSLAEMHTKLYAMAITVAQVYDLMTKLTAMSEQVDSLKDLLLSAHFKIDSVKDVTKETGVDVVRIHLRLDQIVKEAIKIATKVQAGSKAISTSLSSRFEEISTRIVNTLTYFLCPR
ncbi:hypothetical protein H5410_040647 [Solanum commersonii]|uniref:Uncharacterized protein n=1 Tax=Solanum commersonii TaxID=4109 RepID=A0A9J5XQR0_SOLCO|nr:hypothetical protein H5410_040647 [Solanum commersonii]